jgi:hypothetical protein
MSILDRLLSVAPERVLFRLLPSKPLTAIPFNNRIDGRLRDGVDRAYGLEFGQLRRAVWRDPLYRKALKASQHLSIMDYRNKMNLFLLLRFYLPKLVGQDVIELGSFRGGNLLFMATILKEVAPNAVVLGLDTFEGMPPVKSDMDMHVQGDFSDSNIQHIERAATEAGLNNIILVKGDVRETLAPACKDRNIGLAHIDLDIYEPILFAQSNLIHQMVSGAYIVYDDALASSCPGAMIAVEEFIRAGNSCEQAYPHFVFRV